MSTALFSGRFDPVSTAHLIQVKRLLSEHEIVKAVVLDYPERKTPLCLAVQILIEMFGGNKEDESGAGVGVMVNKIHFGEITKEQIDNFQPFDVYVSGNISVLKHVESLGVKVKYIDRAYPYSAHNIKLDEN
ncbi:MAG: hypothetical protein KKD77_20925 [Gammaproteobacteria bacterium]|nr:hypothetical protein [Gammaproteobacteria bacterium]